MSGFCHSQLLMIWDSTTLLRTAIIHCFWPLSSIPGDGRDSCLFTCGWTLGGFQFRAFVNKAAGNSRVPVFVWTCLHFSWANTYEWNDNGTFNFLINYQRFSKGNLSPFTFPTGAVRVLSPTSSLGAASHFITQSFKNPVGSLPEFVMHLLSWLCLPHPWASWW